MENIEIQEEQLSQEPQVPLQQDPPSKKLWQGLIEEELYSKSFEEFQKQYSNKESLDKLYNGLIEEQLYSKTKDDFENQYFPELKKKEPSVPSSQGLQAGVSVFGTYTPPKEEEYFPGVPVKKQEPKKPILIDGNPIRDYEKSQISYKLADDIYNSVYQKNTDANNLEKFATEVQEIWNPTIRDKRRANIDAALKERNDKAEASKLAQEKLAPEIKKITDRVESEFDNYTMKSTTGMKVVDPRKVNDYANKIARNIGVSENGYFQKLIYNEILPVVTNKIIEPEVIKEAEKLYKQQTGRTLSDDLKNNTVVIENEKKQFNNAQNNIIAQIQSDTVKKINIVKDNYVQRSNEIKDSIKPFQDLVDTYSDLIKDGKFTGTQQQYNEYQLAYNQLQERLNQKRPEFEQLSKQFIDEQNLVNTKANARYRRQVEELARVYEDKMKAKISSNPELQKKINKIYSEAYKNVLNKNNEYKRLVNDASGNFIESGAKSFLSALGSSISGLSSHFNIKEGEVFGDFIEGKFDIGRDEINSFIDLLNPQKLSKSIGQLGGGMAIPLIGTALSVAGARGAGANAFAQMAIGGALSFVGETADMAGRMKKDIFAQTGDIVKAEDAAAQVIKGQRIALPLYALDGLPFVGNAVKLGKNLITKAIVGGATEFVSELAQEYKQNLEEEAIKETGDYRNALQYHSMEKLKNTALQIAPVFGLGAGGQLMAVDEKAREKQEIDKAAKSFALKVNFSELAPTQKEQFLFDVVQRKGTSFASAYLLANYTSGSIDKATFDNMSKTLANSANLISKSKELGLTPADQKIFTAFTLQYDKTKEAIEKEEDPLIKKALEAKLSDYENQLKNITTNKKANYVVLTYPNNEQYVFTYAEAEEALNNSDFSKSLGNDDIKLDVFGENKRLVDRINEIKEQQVKVEPTEMEAKAELPVKETPIEIPERPKEEGKPEEISKPIELSLEPVKVGEEATQAELPVAEKEDKVANAEIMRTILDESSTDKEAEALTLQEKDNIYKAIDSYERGEIDGVELKNIAIDNGMNEAYLSKKLVENKATKELLELPKSEAQLPPTPEKVTPKVEEKIIPQLNKDNQVEFTTKSGKQKVNRVGDELVIIDAKTGNKVSKPTEKKAIKEYIDNFDFTIGEEGESTVQSLDPNEMLQEVVDTSNNPHQLATIYAEQDIPFEVKDMTKDDMIADYGIGSISKESYRRFGDINRLSPKMRANYIAKKGDTPTTIDSLAKSMSEYYFPEGDGTEISPQDLIDFMEKYESKKELIYKKNPLLSSIEDKFQKLTGIRLTREVAQKAIDQKIQKLSQEEQNILKQEYESEQQLTDEYWKAYKETDGFTKEAAPVETEQRGEPIEEQKPAAEPKPELPSEVKEEKTALQKASEARKAAKAKLDSLRKGLGINEQAKLEALVDYHRALVSEAKEFIKEKADDINEWAKSIGEKVNVVLQKAWDEAKGAKPVEKAEDLGYGIEDIAEEVEPIKLNESDFGTGEQGKENKKEFDKLTSTIPNTGEVTKYLSGETITKYEEDELRNEQEVIVQGLREALTRGIDIVNKGRELFGEDYVQKLLDYVETENLPPANKALIYVSLENEIAKQKIENPSKIRELEKLQDLVRTKSQAFLRSSSLAINFGRLRKIAEIGYDVSKLPERFFTSSELENKKKIEKAVEATPDEINKQAALNIQEIEDRIREGVESEITKIYEKLPKAKKDYANKAIAAIEKIQANLRNKYFSDVTGVVAMIDAGFTAIKHAIKLGATVSDAVEIGVSKIKELYKDKFNKEWDKAEEFRKDAIDMYSKENLKFPQSEKSRLEKQILELDRQIQKGEKDKFDNKKSKESDDLDKLRSEKEEKEAILEALDPNPKMFVQNALIEQGFGRQVNVKTKEGVVKRWVLDWKKLAGEEGSVDKIKQKVESVLRDKGYTEGQILRMQDAFVDEYNNIRASVIEKSMNEIASKNKQTVTPEQKSAAKKLAEMYNYGLFDKDPVEYEMAIAKTLGLGIATQNAVKKSVELGKAMSDMFNVNYEGRPLTESQLRTAIQVIEEKMRAILFSESMKQGNVAFRLSNITKIYMDMAQRMLLNTIKQGIENPISGLFERIYSSIGYSGKIPSKLNSQQRELARGIYKEMVLQKGIGYGNVGTAFVAKGNLDAYLEKMSDHQLTNAIISIGMGKTILDAVDSSFKAKITQQKFTYNLIKILTQDRKIDGKVEKGMSLDGAKKYVAEKISGQSFEDAKETARAIIKKSNESAKEKIFNDSEEFVNRLATDIVNASLVNGEKITEDMVTAAYNAAYKAAGRGLGHVANNFISESVSTVSGKLESKINEAIKEKNYTKATLLNFYSIFYRNIANPFVGGGTNWIVLKAEKSGLGLLSGLGSIMLKKGKPDLTTENGLKNLENSLYEEMKIRDKFIRGAVGGAVTALTYLLIKGTDTDDKFEEWLKKNEWTKKYINIFTPEIALALMAAKSEKTYKKYLEASFNKNEAFDKGSMAIKAATYLAAGKKEKGYGKLGELIGGSIGAPVPWRLIRDGQQIYVGAKGEVPYKVDPSPSRSFLTGFFKGGFVDYLGYAPKDTDLLFKDKMEEPGLKMLANAKVALPELPDIEGMKVDKDERHLDGKMTKEEGELFKEIWAKNIIGNLNEVEKLLKKENKVPNEDEWKTILKEVRENAIEKTHIRMILNKKYTQGMELPDINEAKFKAKIESAIARSKPK